MNQKWGNANFGKRARRIVAATTALTFLCQNFAWAVCADGSTFPTTPPSAFVRGQAPAVNWSPNVFAGVLGSVFIPDNSVFEHNDPTQPLTGGGHNWVFDQGSTLCKETDTGPAGGTPTAWAIPPFNPAQGFILGEHCILLPRVTGSTGNPPLPIIQNFSDIPQQGDALTPTCDPTQYVGGNPLVGPALPTNTFFNHLGCSISRGAATTPQTAVTYLFLVGINGGMFKLPLANVNPVVGGEAGKVVQGAIDWFGQIPLGQKLTSAAVSPDGLFVMATSNNRLQSVFACLNPLGDPTGTDPVTGVQSFPITGPINPFFAQPPNAGAVPCMQVANNGLPSDVTTAIGPDSQPYFGGLTGVNSINPIPGGTAATAWPQCIFNGFGFPNPAPTTLLGKLAVVFNAKSANHCGTAQVNSAFVEITEWLTLLRHGSYFYAGASSGQVLQYKVTVDPVSGLSQYKFRLYVGGLQLITGIGIADDLKSLIVYDQILSTGSWQAIKVPLCEDL
jgi:hypothetical protein